MVSESICGKYDRVSASLSYTRRVPLCQDGCSNCSWKRGRKFKTSQSANHANKSTANDLIERFCADVFATGESQWCAEEAVKSESESKTYRQKKTKARPGGR